MTWNLFIDDERNPEDVTWAPWQVREKYRNEEWVIARDCRQAWILINERGMPNFISFDHDLGCNKATGYNLAKDLVNDDLIGGITFPDNFDFYVHSQNPIGKANIEGLLNNYLEHREK